MKLVRVVVDTNVLIAVMVDNDRNHKEALGIWESITQAVVPTVVLFELAFFLVKFGLSLELLEELLTDPKIEVVPNNLDDMLYLTRHSKIVKYYDDVVDLIVLSTARRLGIELRSFDKSLLRFRD